MRNRTSIRGRCLGKAMRWTIADHALAMARYDFNKWKVTTRQIGSIPNCKPMGEQFNAGPNFPSVPQAIDYYLVMHKGKL